MSYDPDLPSDADVPPPGDAAGARKRVQVPAILLIVVGVLNVLMAFFPVQWGLGVGRATPEELAKAEEDMKKNNPEQYKQWQEAKKQGWTLEGIMRGMLIFFYSWSGVDFLAGLLTIAGGVRMLALRSYGLAVFAALLAAIPFVSCSGCFLLGEAVGLWALIVLMNGDVRAAFR
jgi:hypothetical protein